MTIIAKALIAIIYLCLCQGFCWAFALPSEFSSSISYSCYGNDDSYFGRRSKTSSGWRCARVRKKNLFRPSLLDSDYPLPLRGGGQEEQEHVSSETSQRNLLVLEEEEQKVTFTINNENNTATSTTTKRLILEKILTPTNTSTKQKQYSWKEFFPRLRSSATTTEPSINTSAKLHQIIRWFMTGTAEYANESDVQAKQKFASLARLLILLRAYEEQNLDESSSDNKNKGWIQQQQVISDITQLLYSSGTPSWVLEQVMERVTEGLTGKRGVQFFLLPRRCIIFDPPTSGSSNSHINMFQMSSGFDIHKLGAVEQVAVRLASFASNTKSSERLSQSLQNFPNRQELEQIKREELQRFNQDKKIVSATEILDLASSTYGLFYFLNSPELRKAVNTSITTTKYEADEEDPFWKVDDSTRGLFTKLATQEATRNLAELKLRDQNEVLYSPNMIRLFRIFSSAGACAMWFGGSVYDMVVSGILAVSVAYIGTSYLRHMQRIAFEERVLTEVVASFFVGMVAGVLAIKWPDKFCFGAIAVASVMDLMQGFKVVYAVIEVMSKNIVTGASRILEGIMFTGLISYSLKFGLDFAFKRMMGGALPSAADYAGMLNSVHGISDKFFPLILPFAATAWSGLFRPSYSDLPLMALHGMLAYTLNRVGAPMFVAAMCVTFSAGIISRFTGREALGNTLAGLYALVPGAYMVQALLSPSRVNFIESVLFSAATIGLGGWTGSILCSPTMLGKSSWSFSRQRDTRNKQQTMLYF